MTGDFPAIPMIPVRFVRIPWTSCRRNFRCLAQEITEAQPVKSGNREPTAVVIHHFAARMGIVTGIKALPVPHGTHTVYGWDTC